MQLIFFFFSAELGSTSVHLKRIWGAVFHFHLLVSVLHHRWSRDEGFVFKVAPGRQMMVVSVRELQKVKILIDVFGDC